MITGLDGSSYTYDAQNRLISASRSGTTVTFKYDALNRQVSRTINGARYDSIWDGWNLIINYDSTNAWTNAYWHGPGGMLAEWEAGTRLCYSDASGSTTHLADKTTGQLLEWYRYDLDGTPIVYAPNNTQPTASAYDIRHLFTGQQWYSEIGLYDLRNRFYSPDIGRFLQADPSGFSGDASNLYRYCGNNPLKFTDPTGLERPWPGYPGAYNKSGGPQISWNEVKIPAFLLLLATPFGFFDFWGAVTVDALVVYGAQAVQPHEHTGMPHDELPPKGTEPMPPRGPPPQTSFKWLSLSTGGGNLPVYHSAFLDPGQSVVVPVDSYSIGNPNGHYDLYYGYVPAPYDLGSISTPGSWGRAYELSLNPSGTMNWSGGRAGTLTGGSAWGGQQGGLGPIGDAQWFANQGLQANMHDPSMAYETPETFYHWGAVRGWHWTTIGQHSGAGRLPVSGL